MQIKTITLALGSNIRGPWGAPDQTMQRVVDELEGLGLLIQAASKVRQTAPLGKVRQPPYLNAVVAITARVPPASLLGALKRLERAAGRRSGPRWGPRPLDIDILTYGGRSNLPQAKRTRQGTLCLPHPNLAMRSFVLDPLAEVAPHWRHPATGLTVRQMQLALSYCRRPRKTRVIPHRVR
jgi:2-amino-4-hydroxy-6-hydroxymethyldihydropteridine diphosphokinase